MLIFLILFCLWLLIGLKTDRQLSGQGMCSLKAFAHTETLVQMSFWRQGSYLDQIQIVGRNKVLLLRIADLLWQKLYTIICYSTLYYA